MTYEETENDFHEFLKSAKIERTWDKKDACYMLYLVHVIHETNIYLKQIVEKLEESNDLRRNNEKVTGGLK